MKQRITDSSNAVAPRPLESADTQGNGGTPQKNRWRSYVLSAAHGVVLLLSAMLIAFISYDTFRNIPFLESRAYMAFQLIVCLVFIFDFFLELALTPQGEKKSYLKSRWLYLVLSVPYLNIIHNLDLDFSPDALYFIRFVPLARGGLALVIVLSYLSSNKLTGIFVSYVAVLVLTVYFAALIFYEREHPVNPAIESYWNAFIWCAQQTTTLGSDIPPVTVAGKIISVILSFMGTLMYPLFTVYLSSTLLKRMDILNIVNIRGGKVKTEPTVSQNISSEGAQVAHTDKK